MSNNAKIVATIKTDIEAENYGILPPVMTGLDMSIQAFKVDVSEPGRDTVHHLVVMGHYPEMDRGLCERIGTRLREYYGDVVVTFTIRDEPRRSEVYIPGSQRGSCSLLSVASAVAVLRRSGSWDDSEWIEVNIEHTKEQIKVSPEYEDGEWVIETYPGRAT